MINTIHAAFMLLLSSSCFSQDICCRTGCVMTSFADSPGVVLLMSLESSPGRGRGMGNVGKGRGLGRVGSSRGMAKIGNRQVKKGMGSGRGMGNLGKDRGFGKIGKGRDLAKLGSTRDKQEGNFQQEGRHTRIREGQYIRRNSNNPDSTTGQEIGSGAKSGMGNKAAVSSGTGRKNITQKELFSSDVKDLIEQGDLSMASKNYYAARQCYFTVQQVEEFKGASNLRMTSALLGLGNFQGGVSSLEYFIQNGGKISKKAFCLPEDKDLDNRLKCRLNLDPYDNNLLLSAAVVSFCKGNLSNASESLSSLRFVNPGHPCLKHIS